MTSIIPDLLCIQPGNLSGNTQRQIVVSSRFHVNLTLRALYVMVALERLEKSNAD